MRKRGIKQRLCQCPACGHVLNFPQTRAQTPLGHIKTAYCPYCQTDRDFVQIDEFSMYKARFEMQA